MDHKETIRVLATDGMLVRRPLLIGDNTALVGFKVEEWEKELI